jgi:hypothetical protein
VRGAAARSGAQVRQQQAQAANQLQCLHHVVIAQLLDEALLQKLRQYRHAAVVCHVQQLFGDVW